MTPVATWTAVYPATEGVGYRDPNFGANPYGAACCGPSQAAMRTWINGFARWSSTPGTRPAGAPYPTFWQYPATGSVPGVSGAVDRNTLINRRSDSLA